MNNDKDPSAYGVLFLLSTLGLIGAIFALVMLSGCGRMWTEQVPPGYVGMVMKPSGIKGTILAPGYHEVLGRDKLVLIETKEQMNSESLSILCKDDLNFSFDLKVRAMLNVKDAKMLKDVLNRQGANIKWSGSIGTLPYASLYKTYLQPIARSIARTEVSKYDTTQIRENREAIQASIANKLNKAMEGTPLSLQMVATSNFDYPDIITKAVEKKRERQLQIKEEEASREIELEKAKNRRLIALEMKAARVAEAEAEAAYNKVLGQSITPNYLRMRELENQAKLYQNTSSVQLIMTDGKTNLMPVFNK